MSETVSGLRERDKWGRRILSHGKGGYSRGCKCPECIPFAAQPKPLEHGVKGYRRGCHCEVCKKGWAEAAVARRGAGREPGQGRQLGEDARNKSRPATLSPRELAAVDQACAATGTPRGAWLRDAALEKLEREGVEVPDDARRQAQRRPNPEQQREEETP